MYCASCGYEVVRSSAIHCASCGYEVLL
ncbi:MAG: zinc ribbon domain-containing protein [Candidatus Poribacteria bacterium]